MSDDTTETRPLIGLLPGCSYEPETVAAPAEPVDVRTSRNSSTRLDARIRLLSAALVDDHFTTLLRELKQASGVGSRTLALRCGVERKSIEQYLRQHDPKAPGGRCSLRWFTRFVEASGGRLLLLMPGGKLSPTLATVLDDLEAAIRPTHPTDAE